MSFWHALLPARWIRKIRRNLLVLAVPDDTHGAADGVAALLPHLKKTLSKRVLIIIDKWLPHLRDASATAVTASPVELVLFAHPATAGTGIAVNPDQQGVRRVLLLPWWQDPQITFRILLAHVCYGATILRTPPWLGVFPRWVSYDGWIDGYFETTRAKQRWSRIAEATIDASRLTDSPHDAANRIRFAYLREMLDIEDNGSEADGDPLVKMHFQQALDILTTS